MFKSNLETRDTITCPLKRRQIAILLCFCLSKISDNYFLIEKQGNRFLRYPTKCDHAARAAAMETSYWLYLELIAFFASVPYSLFRA